MIELTLERRTLREGGTTGPDQNMYRVLCLAMLDEANSEAIYTAEEITKVGVNADQTPGMFSIFTHKIQKAAYAKDMNKTSDLVDEDGEPLQPYGWKRSNWIKHIPTNVYNRAVKIINQACDMHEQSGTDGDTYWYGQSCGLIRVTAVQYATHIERLNKAYQIMGHRASREGDVFRKVGLPLGEIDSPEPNSLPIGDMANRFIFRKKISISVAVVMFGLFAVVASYQGNFWDILESDGVEAAREFHENSPGVDNALALYREASMAFREGNYQDAQTKLDLLLNNPSYENHWGNCLYLKALIESARGNYQSSTDYLSRAEGFADLKNTQSIKPMIYYEMAKNYLFLSDWHSFERYLKLFPDSYEAKKYHLNSWAFLLRDNDLLGAIDSVTASIPLLRKEGRHIQSIFAYADLAIFESINGDVEKALTALSEVDQLLAKITINDSASIYQYKLIALYSLGKCNSWESTVSIKTDITGYANENQKGLYLTLVEIIDSLQCRREHEKSE